MNTPQALSEADIGLAATTARLLSACASTLGALGLGCAALAAAALLLRAPAPAAAWPPAALAMLAVLAAAPLERLLALRLRFDAGLFADLAQAQVHSPRRLALATLDQALHTLRLRPAVAAARPLAQRAQGARRLIAWHAGCTTLQFTGLLLAAALAARGGV